MTRSGDAAIIPITLTVNGRIGLTLWAPPWEDEDGEQWQGFLGNGNRVLLYPNARALADFIASGVENDLSDHPAWGYVQKLTPDQLRPSSEDNYDLDQVYDWASGDPDPVHVSSLADVVDMVAKIADCCDDGGLRRLVENTPAYETLVDEENTYQGRDGRKRWNELGDTISDTWERAITRVSTWLSWEGDFSDSDLEAETVWDRIGAEPIEIVFSDAAYLTIRGDLSREGEDEDSRVAFIGVNDTVAVFTAVADLAAYCRTAEDHPLRALHNWSELAEIEDDEVFAPSLESSYDLRTLSADGVILLTELIEFCNLEIDTETLASTTDKQDWKDIVDNVRSCLQVQD